MVTKIVSDASLVVKWFLEDETEVEQAKKIQEDFIEEKIELWAPDIINFEVANAFNIAVLRKRILKRVAREFLADFLQFKIFTFETDKIIIPTLNLALDFKLSVYDASYVALAKLEKCDFYTGDKRLVNKLKGKVPFVKWLGDYRK